jgi:hypothetical protein
MKTFYTFMVISRLCIIRMRNIIDKSYRENKTLILCSITFFRKACDLGGKMVKYGTDRQVTDDKIIRRMRNASWITNATHAHTHTHTHRICIINCFPRQNA